MLSENKINYKMRCIIAIKLGNYSKIMSTTAKKTIKYLLIHTVFLFALNCTPTQFSTYSPSTKKSDSEKGQLSPNEGNNSGRLDPQKPRSPFGERLEGGDPIISGGGGGNGGGGNGGGGGGGGNGGGGGGNADDKKIPLPEIGGGPTSEPTAKPTGEPTPEKTPPGQEKPTVPPGKVAIKLEVIQLNYEAWWKNCLTVTLGNQSKTIGCNKDPLAQGKVVWFIADKPPICNVLKVNISTFKPTDGSVQCKARAALNPPQMCVGPYAPVADQTRTPSNSGEKQFFASYDYSTIGNLNPLIKANFDFNALVKNMAEYRKNGDNRWIRTFFEDQSSTNLQAVRNDNSLWHDKGIDFNDYIFDIQAEGAKVEIEGSGAGCALQ